MNCDGNMFPNIKWKKNKNSILFEGTVYVPLQHYVIDLFPHTRDLPFDIGSSDVLSQKATRNNLPLSALSRIIKQDVWGISSDKGSIWYAAFPFP